MQTEFRKCLKYHFRWSLAFKPATALQQNEGGLVSEVLLVLTNLEQTV